MKHKENFRKELVDLINCHSVEVRSNTADCILVDYLIRCLVAFEVATVERDRRQPNKLSKEAIG